MSGHMMVQSDAGDTIYYGHSKKQESQFPVYPPVPLSPIHGILLGDLFEVYRFNEVIGFFSFAVRISTA